MNDLITSETAPGVMRVALDTPMPEPLSYLMPPDGPAPGLGELVEVPLGKRREIGCVVELGGSPDPASPFKLRAAHGIASPGFRLTAEIIDLARWMGDYYFASLGECLATASCIGFSDTRLGERTVYTLNPSWESVRMTTRQREVAGTIAAVKDSLPLQAATLARAALTTGSMLHKLRDLGVLQEAQELDVDPPAALPPPDVPPVLLPEQEVAIGAVDEARVAGRFGVFLLHGVTGSGKTEVYLRLIERVFAAGGSALCLVPEIALTPQTVERFSRRFQEEIGVFHSQQSKREKLILYRRIAEGRVRLVIGARSATFAPLPRLGLIIIDEEHDGSYKQSESPRYHARDVAIVRASRLSIPVVLGSATPSMESYDNALRGKYTLLRLTARPAGLQMPTVRVVPMGKQVAATEDTGIMMLSRELKDGIDARLAAGEQSLLFLNRRGFSNFLYCPSCKWVARCSEDDIVLTVHRRGPRGARNVSDEEPELELFPKALNRAEAYLKCHFCGTRHDYPTVCPQCGEDALMAVGSGTQRVEEMLRRVWPEQQILRLDQDAIGGRRAFLEAWHKMVSGEAQIILGTQMIAKGLHLNRVTLVGVILADVGLYVPDFRAEERTFSLLMQVAGRSGRQDPGEVILQTYMPHHPAIQLAARHDYEAFFEAEMYRRRKMRFPPVQRLIALTCSDTDLVRARNAMRNLAGVLRRLLHRHEWRDVAVLGPQPAPVERLAGRFRMRLLLRGASARANGELLRAALADREWRPPSTTTLTVDVDPHDML